MNHGGLPRSMQARREGAHWMVRLDDGEDVFDSLSAFARKEGIRAATIEFGIGMFARASLGYWDGRQYQAHEVGVNHEVVSLHGTIAVADGQPSIHLHCALAGPDHRLVGGHLLRATVRYVQEVSVHAFPQQTFGRPMVESFGLRLLDLEPGQNP